MLGDLKTQVFRVLNNLPDRYPITLEGETIDVAMALTDYEMPFEGISFTTLIDPINEWRDRYEVVPGLGGAWTS